MPAVSFQVKRRVLLVALVAAALSCAVVNAPVSEAQDQEAPSIVGSYPLKGLSGATGWINSKPLKAKELKGKVVLIDFWTYSCINCLRTVPYVRAWADKYKDAGLVVIGVHSPEFEFEGEMPNVEKAVKKFGITYPVAVDSNHAIWTAFHNEYWPAHYFIDATGKVRYEHFGEGDYAQSEQWIQELLKEANAKPMPKEMVKVDAQGIEAAADANDVRSPETYIGYERARNFASPGGIKRDAEHTYTAPSDPQLNEWWFAGKWVENGQVAMLRTTGGKIGFRFHARDLHLVLGPRVDGEPVRFRVTIDGQAPGANHGMDTDTQGNGVVRETRLYQLVRQKGPVADHTFVIEFEDLGVQAFSFTFG